SGVAMRSTAGASSSGTTVRIAAMRSGVATPGRSSTRLPSRWAGKCASASTTASECPIASRWSSSGPVRSGWMPESTRVTPPIPIALTSLRRPVRLSGAVPLRRCSVARPSPPARLLRRTAPARSRSCVSCSSEAVDPPRGAGEDLAALLVGQLAEELFHHLPGPAVPGGEQRHRPVAAPHQAVGPEALERLLPRRPDPLHRARLTPHLQPRHLRHGGGAGGDGG